MRGSHRLGWFLIPLAALGAGCSKRDTEHLATLSQKIASRAESLAETATGSLRSGWQGFRAHQDDGGVDARVSTRLRWDKDLADTSLKVEADRGTITLTGKVSNLEQRQRAVALAESTAGVEKVIDQVKLPEDEK